MLKDKTGVIPHISEAGRALPTSEKHAVLFLHGFNGDSMLLNALNIAEVYNWSYEDIVELKSSIYG